jgi:hypothetical protein
VISATRTEHGGGPAQGRPVRGAGKAALLAIIMVASGAVSACDPIFILKGSVTIPPTLQRSFSPEQRGRLVVVARHAGGGFPHFSWTTLCEPSDGPLVVPFTFQKVGCLQETVVQARLERIVDASPAELPACGSQGQIVRISDDALVASVERTAAPATTGCDSGIVEVNLSFPSE